MFLFKNISFSDDSWLHITPDALEEMLTKKFKSKSETESKQASEEEMKESLTAFLSHVSDMEGAEISADLQEKLRKLSTMSHPRKDSLMPPRKYSNVRKISGLTEHQQRKISSQSNASDGSRASEMSSFSNKIDFNADSFTDAINNILGK